MQLRYRDLQCLKFWVDEIRRSVSIPLGRYILPMLYGTGPMILTATIPPAENITSPSKEFSTSLFPEENEIKPDEYTAPSKYSRENDSNIHQKQDHKLENEEITNLKAPFFEPSEQVVKNKKATKIMIFYSDNTFETFSPDNE